MAAQRVQVRTLSPAARALYAALRARAAQQVRDAIETGSLAALADVVRVHGSGEVLQDWHALRSAARELCEAHKQKEET